MADVNMVEQRERAINVALKLMRGSYHKSLKPFTKVESGDIGAFTTGYSTEFDLMTVVFPRNVVTSLDDHSDEMLNAWIEDRLKNQCTNIAAYWTAVLHQKDTGIGTDYSIICETNTNQSKVTIVSFKLVYAPVTEE